MFPGWLTLISQSTGLTIVIAVEVLSFLSTVHRFLMVRPIRLIYANSSNGLHRGEREFAARATFKI